MTSATDPVLREKVKRLVPKLLLERARSVSTGRAGGGRLRPVRADRGGDLDVDRSLDAVVEATAAARTPSLEELTATTWHRPTVALCLVVDRSGSMDGLRIVTAALATAACALRMAEVDGELSVLAFDRRAEIIRPLVATDPPHAVVERVLALSGHGMTSVDAALRAAADQLAGARAQRRITVLLSDCRATDEIDPVPAGRALDELLVIAPDDDEEAIRFAGDCDARVATLERLDELPAILDRLLAP